MASIQKRGNRWFARYRDDTGREHGQRFDRKGDAQRWLDEQTAAMITGQYCDPKAGRVTFRPYAEQWRITMVHGPSTRNLVERTLRRHVYPALGGLPMGSIRTTTVQVLVTELSGRLAASTLKLAYGYMVAVFRAAVRDKVLATSPCEACDCRHRAASRSRSHRLRCSTSQPRTCRRASGWCPRSSLAPGCARVNSSGWRSARSTSCAAGRSMSRGNSSRYRRTPPTSARSRPQSRRGWCPWRR